MFGQLFNFIAGYTCVKISYNYYHRHKYVKSIPEERLTSMYNESHPRDFNQLFICRSRTPTSKYWIQHMLNKYPHLIFGNSHGIEIILWRFKQDLIDNVYGHTPDEYDKYLEAEKIVYKK
jgi:hypothetical protein